MEHNTPHTFDELSLKVCFRKHSSVSDYNRTYAFQRAMTAPVTNLTLFPPEGALCVRDRGAVLVTVLG